MKRLLCIFYTSCIFLSGCDNPELYFEEGYETGYDEGYDAGYDNGYNTGYDNGYITCIDNAPYEDWFYESIADTNLLTSQNIIEDALYYEDFELVQKLEEYYYRDSLYGNFIGDSSSKLLHLTTGECFDKVDIKNIVLFYTPLELVLEDGIYSKCHCLDEISNEKP